MKVKELKLVKALRAFATDANLDEAAAALLKEAREWALCPSVMAFNQSPEYDENGEYEVILWC